MAHHTFYLGDCLAVLRQLPENSVHCCVTSPPYWALRSYLPDDHPDKALEIGQEATLEEYVERLVEVFRQVRRVLRPEGTLWLNLGDSYAHGRTGGNGATGGRDKSSLSSPMPPTGTTPVRKPMPSYLKPKDLLGIPWRVALALQADGWWLRSAIPWIKTNSLPESVTDRPTAAHEYLFLLSKSRRYYYDPDAIRLSYAPDSVARAGRGRSNSHKWADGGPLNQTLGRDIPNACSNVAGRNARTSDWWRQSLDMLFNLVLDYFAHLNRVKHQGGLLLSPDGDPLGLLLSTEPFSGQHYARFPTELVVPCVLAGTSAKNCPRCGAPWWRVREKTGHVGRREAAHVPYDNPTKVDSTGWMPATLPTDEFRPTCKCAGNDGSGTAKVLDPFGGTGTTSQVAKRLGRSSVYIDLNPQYLEMALNGMDFGQAELFQEHTFEVRR